MNSAPRGKVWLCLYYSKSGSVALREPDKENYMDIDWKGCLLRMCNDYVSVENQGMCGTWGFKIYEDFLSENVFPFMLSLSHGSLFSTASKPLWMAWNRLVNTDFGSLYWFPRFSNNSAMPFWSDGFCCFLKQWYNCTDDFCRQYLLSFHIQDLASYCNAKSWSLFRDASMD